MKKIKESILILFASTLSVILLFGALTLFQKLNKPDFPQENFVYWSLEKGSVRIEVHKVHKVHQGQFRVTEEEWDKKMDTLREWEEEYDRKYSKEELEI